MIRIGLVIFGLLICAWTFTTGFRAGQDIRTNGEVVLFELAPVDPRALFLGDYMTLRYDLLEEKVGVPDQRRGLARLTVDDDGVGRIMGFDTDGAGEGRVIRYSRRSRNRLSIGGERYYFQSGTGERYEAARYGMFAVMPDGRALLIGLADEKRRPILTVGRAPFDRSEENET